MKQPKRVLMLLARDPVFEQRVYQLSARTLTDAGYEVTIVGPRYRDEPAEQIVDGVRIITYRKAKNKFYRKIHTLMTLWKYAQQPYPERVNQAWAAALVLIIVILAINIIARLWVQIQTRRMQGK